MEELFARFAEIAGSLVEMVAVVTVLFATDAATLETLHAAAA